MDGIINKAEQNSKAQKTLSAIEITDDMSAFGIDAQLCIVDGELKYHYMKLKEDVLLKNLAVYNASQNELLSLTDLCNDKTKIENFSIYCRNASDPTGKVCSYIESVNLSVEELINKYTTPEDRKNIVIKIKDMLDLQMEGQ